MRQKHSFIKIATENINIHNNNSFSKNLSIQYSAFNHQDASSKSHCKKKNTDEKMWKSEN